MAKKATKKSLPRPKKTTVFAVILGLVGVGLVVYLMFFSLPTEPEHQTVLPESTSIEELGGWTLVSPPRNDPVFAYGDKIDGTSISVSQQPIPRQFVGDEANKLAELARDYSANREIEGTDTTTYIGNSANGPQSVLLIKNNLLIMIKSQDVITDASWVEYIKSLK